MNARTCQEGKFVSRDPFQGFPEALRCLSFGQLAQLNWASPSQAFVPSPEQVLVVDVVVFVPENKGGGNARVPKNRSTITSPGWLAALHSSRYTPPSAIKQAHRMNGGKQGKARQKRGEAGQGNERTRSKQETNERMLSFSDTVAT